MKEFNLYRVDANYLSYLKRFDSTIPQKSNRPYIAICLEISGHKYAIPITSKRLRSNGKKRNSETTTELIGKNKKDLGAVLYNNMIPITSNLAIPIIFNNENAIDKINLTDKYLIIKKMSTTIKEKAEKVYKKRVMAKNLFFVSFCSDFKLLENKLNEYILLQHSINKQIDTSIIEKEALSEQQPTAPAKKSIYAMAMENQKAKKQPTYNKNKNDISL